MFVNNYLQESSHKTQKVFHNYTVSVLKETPSLAEFVRKVMEEKGLTAREVERKSGGDITHSYVNKIKNGQAKNPSPQILQALAKGLGVTEQEIFDIVRGKGSESELIKHEKLKSIDFAYENMPKQKKVKADYVIDLLEREIKRIEEG